MNIIGVQLILLFFAFFMLYLTYLNWSKKQINIVTLFLWLLIWMIFIFFTLFPNTLQPLINDLFFVRVMDIGMIGAFMILTYICFENNVRIKKHESQLEKLVRKIAMSNKK